MTNETDLIKAAEEALEIAKGNKPAARLHQSGHTYVPKAELEAAQARIAELEGALRLAEADITYAFERFGFPKERSSALTAIRAALEGKG